MVPYTQCSMLFSLENLHSLPLNHSREKERPPPLKIIILPLHVNYECSLIIFPRQLANAKTMLHSLLELYYSVQMCQTMQQSV